MKPKVSFHPLADLELNEAFHFYNAESPGLGAAFLDYGVLYRIKGDTVRILAIMHQKRRPFYWQDRK